MGNRDNIPDITVGFCVRNSEKTVKYSLQSILDQDYPKIKTKIVIVDGNSTDKTMEIARKMLEKSEVESEFLSDEGKGLGTARQIALDHSNGKYVVWIDADIIVSQIFATNQVNYMEQNPEIGVAIGRYLLRKDDSSGLPGLLQSLSKYIGSVTYNKTREYHGLPPNDASIYRTKAAKSVGGFNTAIKGAGEDEDIIIRMINAGWQVSVNEQATFSAFSRQSLKSLWNENIWFGQGKHYIRHKLKLRTPLPIPLVFFIGGLRDGRTAYRLTGQKASFLLSAYFFFGTVAWWFGFTRAHFSGYGHQARLPHSVSSDRHACREFC